MSGACPGRLCWGTGLLCCSGGACTCTHTLPSNQPDSSKHPAASCPAPFCCCCLPARPLFAAACLPRLQVGVGRAAAVCAEPAGPRADGRGAAAQVCSGQPAAALRPSNLLPALRLCSWAEPGSRLRRLLPALRWAAPRLMSAAISRATSVEFLYCVGSGVKHALISSDGWATSIGQKTTQQGQLCAQHMTDVRRPSGHLESPPQHHPCSRHPPPLPPVPGCSRTGLHAMHRQGGREQGPGACANRI